MLVPEADGKRRREYNASPYERRLEEMVAGDQSGFYDRGGGRGRAALRHRFAKCRGLPPLATISRSSLAGAFRLALYLGPGVLQLLLVSIVTRLGPAASGLGSHSLLLYWA